ncbi:hypothetical protein GQ55_6G144900 [Panicum hallii var. hallii]|uniref:Histone-lysine N-methyltransferase NSD-like PHD zinc finger domain-containing protein n=1 Tax=Panicum hallii var. hallii TaxID=1504633 RepID=A0A2T7D670_9POAL|nr:hypothetical protein GQ55_6G144900 [Panicum hallii var. hallii]
MEGGGELPNGVVIDPVRYAGGEGFYNRDPELNDVVCALCGDGGELLCCEGPCLRSYHGTRVAGHPSGCRSLGFTTAVQVFRCDHDTCGRFYHPMCISTQLHPGDPAEAARCRIRVAIGRPFWCQGPHRPRPLVFHD